MRNSLDELYAVEFPVLVQVVHVEVVELKDSKLNKQLFSKLDFQRRDHYSPATVQESCSQSGRLFRPSVLWCDWICSIFKIKKIGRNAFTIFRNKLSSKNKTLLFIFGLLSSELLRLLLLLTLLHVRVVVVRRLKLKKKFVKFKKNVSKLNEIR